jgi:hypothetical protein
MTARGLVWIVGAGFSKSLGAPLLNELLTKESVQRLEAAHPGGRDAGYQWAQPFHEVARLFEAGLRVKDGLGFWDNAEQFIERLDHAEDNTNARSIVNDFLRRCQGHHENNPALANGPKSSTIRKNALTFAAIEIAQFLRGANVEHEAWLPYTDWGSSLKPEDSVITFNYDLVPELLEDSADARLDIVLPSVADQGTHARMDGYAAVYKMHGSISWYEVNGQYGYDAEAPFKSDGRLLIATPGPTKHRLIKKEFKRIWDGAQLALENAEAIVIVGYRMPATDAGTKQWFVQRLRKLAQSGAKFIRVHIVLGPNPNGEDARRLRGLIRAISGRFVVTTWAMGAEDFLGLHERKELLVSNPREIPANDLAATTI